MAHETVCPPSLHLIITSLSNQLVIFSPFGTFLKSIMPFSSFSCLGSVVFYTWNEKQRRDLYGKGATRFIFHPL